MLNLIVGYLKFWKRLNLSKSAGLDSRREKKREEVYESHSDITGYVIYKV